MPVTSPLWAGFLLPWICQAIGVSACTPTGEPWRYRVRLYASIYDSRLMRLASNACLYLYSPSPFSARLLCLTIRLTRTATVQPYSHQLVPHRAAAPDWPPVSSHPDEQVQISQPGIAPKITPARARNRPTHQALIQRLGQSRGLLMGPPATGTLGPETPATGATHRPRMAAACIGDQSSGLSSVR